MVLEGASSAAASLSPRDDRRPGRARLAPGRIPRIVTIALVGFTDSYNDRRWLEMAGAWVARHDPWRSPWTSAAAGCSTCVGRTA